MTIRPTRVSSACALLFIVAAIVVPSACSRSVETPASEPAAQTSGLAPVVSIQELMAHVVDPQADFVFDAVGVDVTPTGTTYIAPATDDDWIKVQRGAIMLAEATNLLKMPRLVAPAGYTSGHDGPGGPELPPAEIQALVDQDRTKWITHVDDLRTEAIRVIDIVKARDAEALFKAGSDIDRACENCHLDYWYPHDRAAVQRDRDSRATVGGRAVTPPEKTP